MSKKEYLNKNEQTPTLFMEENKIKALSNKMKKTFSNR